MTAGFLDCSMDPGLIWIRPDKAFPDSGLRLVTHVSFHLIPLCVYSSSFFFYYEILMVLRKKNLFQNNCSFIIQT